MNLLCAILREEHRTIVRLLEDLSREKITSQQGRELMLRTKILFAEHLKKEDDYLYPELESLQEGVLTANNFSAEMRELKDKANQFFARYEKDGPGMDFSKDLGRLLAALKLRMIKEDNTLFPMYEHLVARK